jgi:hypothetical protein
MAAAGGVALGAFRRRLASIGIGVAATACTGALAVSQTTSSSSSSSEACRKPLLRFGVIADVQYADVDDAYNFSRTEVRGYRGSLVCLKNAVDAWNAAAPTAAVSFVANLGDIIDQRNEASGKSRTALDAVLAEFARVRTTLQLPHEWGRDIQPTGGPGAPFVVHLVVCVDAPRPPARLPTQIRSD